MTVPQHRLSSVLVLAVCVAGCASASPTTPTAPRGLEATRPAPTPRANDSGAAGHSPLVPVVAPSARLTATLLPIHLPTRLSRAAAVPDRSQIVVAGGLTPTGTSAAILRLDPVADTVMSMGRLPTPVHDAAGALAGGRICVFGGGVTVAEATVYEIDAAGAARTSGTLPAPRADLGAATIGGDAIVVGGWTGAMPDRQVLATADGLRFRVVATLPIGVRYAAVAALHGLVYVVGGTATTGDVATIQVVDPVAGTAQVVGSLPYPLSHGTAVVVAGRLLVAGGRRGTSASDTVLEIVPSPFAVKTVGRLPGSRSDAAGVVVGADAYLIGGESATLLDTIVELAFY